MTLIDALQETVGDTRCPAGTHRDLCQRRLIDIHAQDHCGTADDLLEFSNPLFQGEVPEIPQEYVLQFRPVHQRHSGHPETVFRQDLLLQAVQVPGQLLLHLQGALHPEYPSCPLPFLRRAQAQRFFPDTELKTESDAISAVITGMGIDPAQRNVLIAHQFVTGAQQCESEELQVGTADSVDVRVFDGFDYVALGHLHGPQQVGRETVRYCGTPLKYSFSEKDHEKSVTVVELGAKGDVTVRTVPLTPMHDLRELRGSYEELTLRETYIGTAADDYLSIVLTDEQDIPDALAKLRIVYTNIMQLRYDNTRTRTETELLPLDPADRRTALELFEDFYALQNGQDMTLEQRTLAARLLQEIEEAEA